MISTKRRKGKKKRKEINLKNDGIFFVIGGNLIQEASKSLLCKLRELID